MKHLRDCEALFIKQTKSRLLFMNRLQGIRDMESADFLDWSRVRLNRLVADYMMANGYHGAAALLCKDPQLENLVDLGIYKRYQLIHDSILRQELKEVLSWCSEHRAILKKNNSTLELEVRLQRFIELIKSKKLCQAIAFAKAHFGTWANEHPARLQLAAALLAFPEFTNGSPYSLLLSDDRWEYLASLFTSNFTAVHNIPSVPLLHALLAAGLSSLKTPLCYLDANDDNPLALQSQTVKQCPVCTPCLNDLGKALPYAHITQSAIVDSLTGEGLDSDNCPVAFPNGRVYGIQSLISWNEANGTREGFLRDPYSGKEFPFQLLRKVYVV